MSEDGRSEPPTPPATQLDALDAGAWRWLLPHVRAAMHDIPAERDHAVTRRLRAAPTARLAGGRARRELVRVLTDDPLLWADVAARVSEHDPPAGVRALLDGQPLPAPVTRRDGPADRRDGPVEPAPSEDDGRQERRRARERARELQQERDELRRQLDGALARTARADAERARQAADHAAALDQLAASRAEIDDTARGRERAVARERRRRDVEVRTLRDELTAVRRERDEARRERDEARRQRDAAMQRRSADPTTPSPVDPVAPDRLAPGRPSRFPDGLDATTTDGVVALLHPGRLVLVDGYNVTRQRHPELDLEAQRAWLVRTLATLAARYRVRPVAVFDGQRRAGTRPAGGAREVEVRFTPADVTADDELVLAAAATDEPVVVVTDDRELRDRLRPHGVDLVAVQPFLWAAR